MNVIKNNIYVKKLFQNEEYAFPVEWYGNELGLFIRIRNLFNIGAKNISI